MAPKPETGATGPALTGTVVVEVVGLVGEDTEPELVPLEPNWVVPGRLAPEPWDDPAQPEQRSAKIPIAAMVVPFLILIVPPPYDCVAPCHVAHERRYAARP